MSSVYVVKKKKCVGIKESSEYKGKCSRKACMAEGRKI